MKNNKSFNSFTFGITVVYFALLCVVISFFLFLAGSDLFFNFLLIAFYGLGAVGLVVGILGVTFHVIKIFKNNERKDEMFSNDVSVSTLNMYAIEGTIYREKCIKHPDWLDMPVDDIAVKEFHMEHSPVSRGQEQAQYGLLSMGIEENKKLYNYWKNIHDRLYPVEKRTNRELLIETEIRKEVTSSFDRGRTVNKLIHGLQSIY